MEEDVEGDLNNPDRALDWDEENPARLGKKALVGQLFTDKMLNKGTIRNMIMKGWNILKGLIISETSSNIFLFTFDEEEECARILREGPWAILGCILNVKAWIPDTLILDIALSCCLFWVQFHGLPLEVFSDKNVVKLGKLVGQVEEYEIPVEDGKIARAFLRARVVVDISKPLLDGLWIPKPNRGKLWVKLKYERLQQFCFNCGIIGHDQKHCEIDRNDDDSGNFHFNSSLGMAPLKPIHGIFNLRCRQISVVSSLKSEVVRGKAGTIKERGKGRSDIMSPNLPEEGKRGDDGYKNDSSTDMEISDELSIRTKGVGCEKAADAGCRRFSVSIGKRRESEKGIDNSLALVPHPHFQYEQGLISSLQKVSLKRGRDDDSPVRGKKLKSLIISSPSSSTTFVVGHSPSKLSKYSRSSGRYSPRKKIDVDFDLNFTEGLFHVPVSLLTSVKPVEEFVFGKNDEGSVDDVGGWPEATTKTL
ncbi:TMV resistance protein N-like [Senna tora]|uniref:TMV resistance protein N-like n=1 Tax=Senna tora TaxID=362788 RepID=A0A834SYF7_9FABA|nr:TMV resistance protein N-like [Senna tora]